MQILFSALAIVLVGSVFWTQHIFVGCYEREKKQIAIDNAGIAIGKIEREMFQSLMRGNQKLALLEVEHHVAHACAKVPLTAAKCVPVDKALETLIRATHRWLQVRAIAQWTSATMAGYRELEKLETTALITRALSPPIKATKCKLCQLPNAWEVEGEKPHHTTGVFRAELAPLSVGVEFDGATLIRGGKWNYYLTRR